MMKMPLPLTRDLVLIGGGHAHAVVLRMWGMRPLPGVRLTLINPGPTAPYSGMLPGHIAGHYSRDALDIDLVKLARFAGARLIVGEAEAVDPVARSIAVKGRGEIGYDAASIDIGIHTEMPQIPGFAEHARGAKPLDRYTDDWAVFLAEVRAGRARPHVAVIGGGMAGIELALASAHRLRRAVGPEALVALVESRDEIAGRNPATTAALKRALTAHGVVTHTGAAVARIEADRVVLEGGKAVPSAFTLSVTGAIAHPWLADSPLPLTPDGFVRVDKHLCVEGTWDLFAVGDCAHMVPWPRPKAGVYAVRSGPVLFHNLRAVLSGRQPQVYRPQKDYLKLVSLGGKQALAEKWGRTLAGPLLWRWKNRIDTRFMRKFSELPEMGREPLPNPVAEGVKEALGGGHQPLCAGCGSKVGPQTLRAALEGLAPVGRDDVLSGPGDDAGVLAGPGGAKQVLTTDHLRAFTDDPAVMARIAAVHALGDIWAMGAVPQAALVNITLPRMSAALQARSLDEIMQAMDAVLRAEGAAIIGGHSSMGAEMALGLTLTGLVEGPPIGQGGAQPGDALILTRPVGTGTILAAEMRGRARGADVAAMLERMAVPQGDAAKMLSGARAMTDVTGFGLAGHLMAICKASGVAAELNLDVLPVYPGALDLAQAGIRSTAYEENRANAPVSGAQGPRGVLLHDPQTAGGLLAAYPGETALAVTASLRKAGHEAAILGQCVEGTPGIRCV